MSFSDNPSIDNNNPYSTRGLLNNWQENIGQYLAGQSRLLFCVSFALSSFLLHIVGAENEGIHIYGPSSKGKSTLLQICASLFGDAETYKLSWRTTPSGENPISQLITDTGERDNEGVLCE